MKIRTKQLTTIQKLDQLMMSMANKKTYKEYLKVKDKYLTEIQAK
jgi:hypothetical protein